LNQNQIADALLKLHVPGAGFLPDLKPAPNSIAAKVIAPASTVLFTSRSTPSFPTSSNSGPLSLLNRALAEPLPNIPEGASYSDLTKPGTIVVVSQPHGQTCAVMGGIMAVRMKVLGAKGVIVDGRVRDLEAVKELGIPVWAKGTSIVGAGAEAKAWATNVPVQFEHTIVEPVSGFLLV
jgi:regulator of RNase E activity RraA